MSFLLFLDLPSLFAGAQIIIGASLKRAPQLRVDLAFCHDIYTVILQIFGALKFR